jgi:hypothetical protein
MKDFREEESRGIWNWMGMHFFRHVVGFFGKVGVGTDAPASQLSVFDATTPTIRLTNTTTGNTTSDGSVIYASGSDLAIINKEAGRLQLGTTNAVRVAIPTGGIVEFADNAAAVTGGLVAGDLYRTGDALKIVHA